MASAWEDFENPDAKQRKKLSPNESREEEEKEEAEGADDNKNQRGCNWGFERPDCESDATQPNYESSKFISLYEQYLNDKKSFDHKTRNHQLYSNNPSKALSEWFNYEGHDYCHKLEQTRDSQYRCSIDVPVGDQDFTFESEAQVKKQSAIDEVCLIACKILDECDLLKSWQQDYGNKDPDRKRRIDEANKEDDIELDNTKFRSDQEPKPKKTTLESLRGRWTQLNMHILSLKAKLVKLDLSVSNAKQKSDNKKEAKSDNNDGQDEDEDDEEEDPLDAFMSNLDKKSELSLDDKIEKSRLKTQISSLEREQEEISEKINEINS